MACLLLFLVLKLAGINTTDAAKFGLTPFGAIALVNAKIEERSRLKSDKPKLQTFSDFSVPVWKGLVLAGTSAFALVEVTSLFAGAASAVATTVLMRLLWGEDVFHVAALAVAPLNVYILFATGRWIGIRSERGAYILAALTALLVKLADLALTLFLVPPEAFRKILGFSKTDVGSLAKQVAVGLVIFGGFSLLGCWRGRRRRQAWYLDHLLRSVAPESRGVIIDLAYDEAQKTLAPAGGLSQGARA